MRDELTALLHDIDAWARAQDVRLPCYLLGGGVLRLYDGVGDRTKDLDCVEEPLGDHAAALLESFGETTGRKPYLDVVSGGLPVLPVGWRERALPQEGDWTHLDVFRLSPADHVASKLKAFRPHDRRDIKTLCDLYPELEQPLAALSAQDFWQAPDVWERRIEPHRDRVLAWLRGASDAL